MLLISHFFENGVFTNISEDCGRNEGGQRDAIGEAGQWFHAAPLPLRRATESGALMREKAEQGLPREAEDPLKLWSPTFLASGTAFVEDSFSMDQGGRGERDGFRLIQVHYVYYATADLIGGGAQAVT